jgi:dUTP pyrophosphatase
MSELTTLEVQILDDRLDEYPCTYGSPGAAGLDLRACIETPLILKPSETHLVSTGLAIHLGNRGYAALILPRSGLGHKHGVILGNTVGLIDSDYQGPLMISLWNRSDIPYTIQPMDRVAQLVIVPVIQVSLKAVKHFDSSARGGQGFGSTGQA